MSPNIDIPAPLDGDSDSVVTALETAAVFAGRGDPVEALRWLKRAAESSGESGDDARTLTLARTAADLTSELQSARETGQSGAPLPTREPALLPGKASETPRSALLPGKASETPRSALLPGKASETPRSALLPGKASETPRSAGLSPEPRPSEPAKISPIVQISDRPQALQPSQPAPSQSAQASQRWLPKPPARSSIPAGAERTTTHPPPPSSRPMTTPTPPSAKVRPVGARELFGSSVPPAARQSVMPARDTLTPARDTLSPVRDTLTSPLPPSVGGALAQTGAPALHERNGAHGQLSIGPRPSARVERPDAEPRLRQAARVSVVRSATEPGLYLVRVIEDGKPAPSDAAEALLVLVDPNSTVFSR